MTTMKTTTVNAAAGFIQIEVVLPWPYKVLPPSAASVSGGPAGITWGTTSQSASPTSSCVDTVGSQCKTYWTFPYTAGAPACSLTSSTPYMFTFVLGCQTSHTPCALTGNSEAIFPVNLYSSNFCSHVIITVPLSGTLVSYDNAALAVADQETVFPLGANIYLVASTISVQPIISVVIQTLTLNAGNVAAPMPVQLWSLTGITAAGTIAGIVLTPSSPAVNQAQAHFKVIGSQFGAKPNVRTPATMTCLLLVTFLDTAGQVAKELVTMTVPHFGTSSSVASNSLNLATKVEIEMDNTEDASTGPSPYLALLAVFPLLGTAFMIRQCVRKSPRKAAPAVAGPASPHLSLTVADSSV